MDKVQVREVGIRVGGRMYSHPEEVRNYMKTPPCDSCGYKDICEKPCPLKKNLERKESCLPGKWRKAVKEGEPCGG